MDNYTLNKIIELNPLLMNEYFYKYIYFKDVKSLNKVVYMLNTNDSNKKIQEALIEGFIIVFSESTNKFFLVYRNINKYVEYLYFKKTINNLSKVNLLKLLKNICVYLKYNIPFKKISNKNLFELKYIFFEELKKGFVIKYYHYMKQTDRIFRNIDFNNLVSKEVKYYNYIVDKNGIVLGEVFDSFELGTSHSLLVDKYNDNVFIAGEIKIENNNLSYNFISDIYCHNNDLFLITYMEIILSKLFKSYNLFESTAYTHLKLIPIKIFTKKDFDLFTKKYKNIKMIDNKISFKKLVSDHTFSLLSHTIRDKIANGFLLDKLNQLYFLNSNYTIHDYTNSLSLNYETIFSSVKEGTIKMSEILEDKSLSLVKIIEKALRNFGLNKIIISDINNIKLQYSLLINNPDYLAVFEKINNDIIYNRRKSNGTIEKRTFRFKSYFHNGAFNKTEIYYDILTNKEYLVRFSDVSSYDAQFYSFYENLKHIILYIIIYKYAGNIKMIPEPYYLGVMKDTKTIYMIMEKAEFTLGDYITKTYSTDKNIRKMIFTIYSNLVTLEEKTRIGFRHHDLKLNNIVITNMGIPLIIDFGFSQFNIQSENNKIEFVNPETFAHSKYYDSNKYFGYNMVHDILHLITSCNYVYKNTRQYNSYIIFQFNTNKNNIMNGDTTLKYMCKKYLSPFNEKIFFNFYGEFKTAVDLINDVSYMPPNTTIYITPKELEKNIDI